MTRFFAQDCPTCGRRLHIANHNAHQMVACQHCRGAFRAVPPRVTDEPQRDWRTELVKRADELLAMAAAQISLAGAT